tara:strand:+ start:14144 stop:15130 length:987 start_codon:yes stop_codon:yes gene_type:complete
MKIYPSKLNLKSTPHIRVIAPSRSLKIISYDNLELASRKLKELGFEVSFSENAFECDEFSSSSIQSRIDDIHEAIADPSVDCILTAIGGYSSNQLLDSLDYDLIKANPKPICGFSDITTLTNAIYAQTGLVGYSGPHFSTFAMKKGLEYTVENFLNAMTLDKYEVKPAATWSDDPWFEDQEKREFFYTENPWVINEAKETVAGTCLGGNLSALRSLQGTKFFPDLHESVVMVEVTDLNDARTFQRNLVSLTQQAGFDSVKAILIGRFQKGSLVTKEELTTVISNIGALRSIPVIANLDFGHTTPIFTFPVGGEVTLAQEEENISITFK